MSAERRSQSWVARSSGRLVDSVRARPWRMAMLLAAMVAVMIVGMLFATPEDDPVRRWEPVLGTESSGRAGDGGSTEPVSGTDGRDTVPAVQGGDAPAASGTDPGGSQSGSPGGTDGTGAGSGSSSAGDPATVVKDPPLGTTQPTAPAQPERLLDPEFGESLFPDSYPGLKLVIVFAGDDDEVTATYKSDGSTQFDLVRVTVQRADSNDAASAVAEQTLALYGSERTMYPWGGRDITQALGLRSGDGQAIGFVWRQGRYCIDVTVFPPYSTDIAAGRDGALEFIGRLGY